MELEFYGRWTKKGFGRWVLCILSGSVWCSMSTRNVIGCGQNSAHPFLDDRSGVLNCFGLCATINLWMRSEVPQMYIFLNVSYCFLCFWTPFKGHKERCEVPHVALVPLFEEACDRCIVHSAITWGSCVFTAHEHHVSCDANTQTEFTRGVWWTPSMPSYMIKLVSWFETSIFIRGVIIYMTPLKWCKIFWQINHAVKMQK